MPSMKPPAPQPSEDDVLRRMLATPHKPHAPIPKRKRAPKKTAKKPA